MSQKNDYPIHCPQCQHAFSQALYDAVTLAEEPEAKQALLGNTLNRVLCPECQHDFRIDKALLYNDAANGLLIYWMPATGDQVDAVINQFDDMMQAMAEITPDGVTPPSVQLVLERTGTQRVQAEDPGEQHGEREAEAEDRQALFREHWAQ